jgi:predicted short-subunit dehydrogenase-like oxidoreductase (DUF2520 family)
VSVQGITVVGPGRLGGALALALSHAGFRIDTLVYRSRRGVAAIADQLDASPAAIRIDDLKKIDSPVVIIAVQDEELADTVRALKSSIGSSSTVFHTSGSLSSDILASLRTKRRAIASLHPLASVSNWNDGQHRFRSAYFCLEGDRKAIKVGKELIQKLGGHSTVIDGNRKALYHAAALTAAGHVTALFDVGLGFMVKAGIDRKSAKKMLQPLLAGVAKNLSIEDTAQALTGTYARGDLGTMQRHLEALRTDATIDESMIYLELAARSIDLAEKAGTDPAKLKQMSDAIMVAKENLE